MGFRSQSSVCTSLTDAGGDRRGTSRSRSCLSERLLHRALENGRFHTFGGGGGGEHTFAMGFARAEVAALSLVGSNANSRVVLSEP